MTIDAEIFYGELPQLLKDTEGETTTGQLDTLTLEVLANYPAWRQDLQELGYVRGQKINGYHAMFVEDYARGNRSELTCEVTVNCLGLLEPGDKRRRTLGVNGQQISVGPYEKIVLVWEEAEQGEDPATGDQLEKVKRRIPAVDDEGEIIYRTIATPTGNAERWNIRQAIVTVTDTYFTTTQPVMNGVGSSSTPSNAPSVPAFSFSGYDAALRYNHPTGWVLDDRQVEELFNHASGGLWAVTDTYGYYYSALPD